MKDKKNVLLIIYYWPPSGGAGVHRWLRFSQFFTENNVNLTVYCPKDAAWPSIDPKLEAQVSPDIKIIRRKIFEPQRYLGKKGTGTGFTEQKKATILKKLMIWIRGNLFIPDSRVFWIKPSVRYLGKYLKEHPEIDTIISSGPPHSMHLIALELKKKFKLKWIADFRDPWTQIDFYHDLLPGKHADRKHRHLEKECLTQADEVLTVSKHCAMGLEEISKRKVHVISNGFIFPVFDPQKVELDTKFSIVHFGSMPLTRNPEVLWKVLKQIVTNNNEFANLLEVRLIGTVDYQVAESFTKHQLKDYVNLIPSVDHAESLSQQRSCQLLLLVANNSGNVKGILTGKFFEYLGAKRPILAIGTKESDLEEAMLSTDAGCFIDYDESEKLKDYLLSSFKLFQENKLYHEAKDLEQYNSKNLAEKVIKLL